jgi:hypothetical protein
MPQICDPQINHPSVHFHINDFFYQLPNYPFIYHIKCEKATIQLLNNSFNTDLGENEYIFFYQQEYNDQPYQISCEIFSPSLINDYLNKNIYGVEIKQDLRQEQFVFTSDQKEMLKSHLTKYLCYYLLN